MENDSSSFFEDILISNSSNSSASIGGQGDLRPNAANAAAEDEKDELGPILDTNFRVRCWTWPRHYLEQQDPAAVAVPPSASFEANSAHTSASLKQQQPITISDLVGFQLPQVSEESSSGASTNVDFDAPCGSPKQKNSSRRNAWGNLSYADLITQAIKSSPEQRLTLSQIYDWVVKNVPYFKDKGDSASSSGWKNSIRHNLSLHSRFKRVQNEGQGKSSWWMMNPEVVKSSVASSSVKHCHVHHYGHYRKRANTLESASRAAPQIDKRRPSSALMKRRDSFGSARSSVTSGSRLDLQRTASSGSLSYPESPEFTMRPRTLSNASSCGGRMSPCLRTRTLSNASSTATLEPLGPLSPPPQPWPQNSGSSCHSPIATNIARLGLEDIDIAGINDDLEDINNLIKTEVGDLPAPNPGFIMYSPAQITDSKIKILEPRSSSSMAMQEQQPTAAQNNLRNNEDWYVDQHQLLSLLSQPTQQEMSADHQQQQQQIMLQNQQQQLEDFFSVAQLEAQHHFSAAAAASVAENNKFDSMIFSTTPTSLSLGSI